MKKCIALVLSLVMALSLCVPAWGAESVGSFDQLKDAIAAGKTDIEVTGKITLAESLSLTNVTINTGTVEDAFVVPAGYTLTLGAGVTINAAESILYANGGTIDIDGATLVSTHTSHALGFVNAGGTINMNSGSVTAYWTGLTASGAGSAVNILGGTVESTNSNATLAKNSGTTTVTGGTIKTHGDFVALWAKDSGVLNVNGGAAIAPTNGAAISVEGATATVSAGNFSGPVKANATGSISITGGTFEDEPADTYVADGYEVFAIDEGGYLVAKSCSVTFDANGGNGVLTQEPVPAGQFILPTEHPFTREGYTFVGWATDKNATKVLGTTYNVTGDVTFYAIWEKEECTGDSHVEIVVEYSGDVATKVYCDYCGITFAFIQGTEEDAKAEFGEGNYVKAENDVWYTLKAVIDEVPSVPEIPPVEDDKTEGEKVAVTTPAEVDTVVNDKVIDTVKNSDETIVTVPTPVEGDADAETIIKFDSADAKDAFVNATATDITTALTAVEAPVTDEVTAKVEEKVSDDAELAAYLDIDITVFADGDPVGEITQLPKEIKVVIPASALNFGDLEKNHTRKVSVIRFHDDQVDVIPAKLEANGSVSFYSHLFSTYAVVYEDVYTGGWGGYYPIVDGTTTTDEDIKSPETFDAGIALYVGMSVAAAVGTVTLSKKRED